MAVPSKRPERDRAERRAEQRERPPATQKRGQHGECCERRDARGIRSFSALPNGREGIGAFLEKRPAIFD